MDNEERQQNTAQQEPAEEKASPKRKGGRHLGLLTLVLAAVLAVTALTTMEDGRHFAALRRWLMYGDDSTAQNLYLYPPDKGNQWGLLGENLLVVSPNGVQLCRNDGTDVYRLPLSAKSPSLSVGKTMAAVCDVGGSSIYILDQMGLKQTIETDGELRFYTARFNSADLLTVTEERSGYKTSVTVYNRDLEIIFHFDSHDTYISDALATEDGRYLLAVRMDAEGGAFTSRLLVYDMVTAEKCSEASARDGLVLELESGKDRVLALCDKRLMVTDLEGETCLDQSFGSLYLHGCALGGKDFCALLLGRYQSGNICTLTTYDWDGQTLGSLELTEEVLDLDASGDRLAVLYSNSLVVYDKMLQEVARLEDTDYAGRVIMEPDGTVLVIGGTAAHRFLP